MHNEEEQETKPQTYRVSFDFYVDGTWIDDGISCSVLKRRIREELASHLLPYAYSHEAKVKNISVSLKKKG